MYNLQAVSDYSEETQTLRRFNPDRACLAVKTRDDALLLQYLHDKNIPIVQCAVLTNAFVQELYFPHGGITARSKYYLTHNGFGSFFFFLCDIHMHSNIFQYGFPKDHSRRNSILRATP